MLRIILWKLGIEWAHLKRALWPQWERKVYYFAFGANLCRDVLEQRRIRVFESFDYELPDAELCFTQPGFYRGHGYASADVAEGSAVYGKIYLILETDARRMDYFEGVPFIGAHDKVFREAEGLGFFYYRTTRIVSDLKPTRDYLDFIVDAYRQMPIVPDDYLQTLESTEVLDCLQPIDETSLFVRDVRRWPACMARPLLGYERLCLKMVEFTWHRSPLQRLIRP
ncbi:MAG TPA: gamma-glutamylcyclotransferase family protein [Gammaproteobacteria bacterium]|nr:gamma-glutamylcyclotransferase family protein [Gammaproteobacteria bacterium]